MMTCMSLPLVAGCGERELRYDSPEAVFEAFRSGLAARDYDQLLHTCDPRLRPEWKTLLSWARAFENGQKEAGAEASPPSEYDLLARMAAQYVDQEITYEQQGSDMIFAMVSEEGPGMPLRRYDGKWYVSFYFDDLEGGRYSLALATEILKAECRKLRTAPPGGSAESEPPSLKTTRIRMIYDPTTGEITEE